MSEKKKFTAPLNSSADIWNNLNGQEYQGYIEHRNNEVFFNFGNIKYDWHV